MQNKAGPKHKVWTVIFGWNFELTNLMMFVWQTDKLIMIFPLPDNSGGAAGAEESGRCGDQFVCNDCSHLPGQPLHQHRAQEPRPWGECPSAAAMPTQAVLLGAGRLHLWGILANSPIKVQQNVAKPARVKEPLRGSACWAAHSHHV